MKKLLSIFNQKICKYSVIDKILHRQEQKIVNKHYLMFIYRLNNLWLQMKFFLYNFYNILCQKSGVEKR